MKAEYEKEMLKRDLELVRLKDEMKLKLDHSNQINELKLELAKAQNQTENEKIRTEMERMKNDLIKNQNVIINGTPAINQGKQYFNFNQTRIGSYLIYNPSRRSVTQNGTGQWSVAQTCEPLNPDCFIEFIVENNCNVIIGVSPLTIAINGHYPGINTNYGVGYQYSGTFYSGGGGSHSAFNSGDKIKIVRDHNGWAYSFYRNDVYVATKSVALDPFQNPHYPTVAACSSGSVYII